MSVEVDSQYGSMLAEKEESRRERWVQTQTAASKYEPKEYELYVRRARYKLWLATCMRVITYRDLTVSFPLPSQTSSGKARAITLSSFKLLSRRVTYVTALRGYL